MDEGDQITWLDILQLPGDGITGEEDHKLHAGFLERDRDGRQTWYSVNTDGVQTIRQLLDPDPGSDDPASHKEPAGSPSR